MTLQIGCSLPGPLSLVPMSPGANQRSLVWVQLCSCRCPNVAPVPVKTFRKSAALQDKQTLFLPFPACPPPQPLTLVRGEKLGSFLRRGVSISHFFVLSFSHTDLMDANSHCVQNLRNMPAFEPNPQKTPWFSEFTSTGESWFGAFHTSFHCGFHNSFKKGSLWQPYGQWNETVHTAVRFWEAGRPVADHETLLDCCRWKQFLMGSLEMFASSLRSFCLWCLPLSASHFSVCQQFYSIFPLSALPKPIEKKCKCPRSAQT